MKVQTLPKPLTLSIKTYKGVSLGFAKQTYKEKFIIMHCKCNIELHLCILSIALSHFIKSVWKAVPYGRLQHKQPTWNSFQPAIQCSHWNEYLRSLLFCKFVKDNIKKSMVPPLLAILETLGNLSDKVRMEYCALENLTNLAEHLCEVKLYVVLFSRAKLSKHLTEWPKSSSKHRRDFTNLESSSV